jgi:FkbM family methyltransferase
MQLNNISKDKYKIVPLGLGNKKSSFFIVDDGASVSINSKNSNTNRVSKIKVEVIPLDDYTEKNQLKVGLIKVDIEGVGFEALQGMTKTIQRDRPVLSLSIYHNAKEFFGMKPLLETITHKLNYKIRIEKNFPSIRNDKGGKVLNLLEITLFAYPNELE